MIAQSEIKKRIASAVTTFAIGFAAIVGARSDAGVTNTIIPIDISNSACWDNWGDPDNVVVFVDLAAILNLAPGSSVTATSLGCDVNLVATTTGLINIALNLDDTTPSGLSSYTIQPANGKGSCCPGTGHYAFGQQDFTTAFGEPNLVLIDGILRIEFYNSGQSPFGEAGVVNAIDGWWSENSTLFIGVQEIPLPPNPCPPDINNSGGVDVDDLIAVILGWGPCGKPPASCPADTNNSGTVDVDDLIAVILAWGDCP